MFVRYLRAELQVRTRGIHDYLLRNSALITDPEGTADNATKLLWGHNMSRLHHLQHCFSKGWSIPFRRRKIQLKTIIFNKRKMIDTWSGDGNPWHPRHPSKEGYHQIWQAGYQDNRRRWPLWEKEAIISFIRKSKWAHFIFQPPWSDKFSHCRQR